MRKHSFQSKRVRRWWTYAVVGAVLILIPAFSQAQTDIKTCKRQTKTMGCTLSDGIASVLATSRAAVVAAEGPLSGKCQIDSPAVQSDVQTYTEANLACNDESISDTSDKMIELCKAASTKVRGDCRTICAKLDKVDPLSGDPVPDTPCHMLVDRTMVTTTTDRVPGPEGCIAKCTASIVCVCDP